MATKPSEQINAEPTTNFYGINPESLLVESVTLNRGGTLTRWRVGKRPSAYRIKRGRPAREEVSRVFGLVDVVAVSSRLDTAPGAADHPLVAALQRTAAARRRLRDQRIGAELK